MSSINRSTLTLSQFMLRQQVLKQYRDFLRLIRLVEKESDRNEIRCLIREDFKRNKLLSEEELIRMQLTRGKIELKKLESTLTVAFGKK